MALTRISLTIPFALLRQLDQRATALDRSRSRVVADAIRQFLAGEPAAPKTVTAVHEPAADPYRAALFAEARTSLIRADLALPPAERLRRAEALLILAPRRSPGKRHQVIAFDSYDDYYEWKKTRNVT